MGSIDVIRPGFRKRMTPVGTDSLRILSLGAKRSAHLQSHHPADRTSNCMHGLIGNSVAEAEHTHKPARTSTLYATVSCSSLAGKADGTPRRKQAAHHPSKLQDTGIPCRCRWEVQMPRQTKPRAVSRAFCLRFLHSGLP